MIAFLDASALIYLLEGEVTWARAVQRELQQLAEHEPTLPIVLSRLSMLECRVGPYRRGDEVSLGRFEAFFAQPDLVWVELNTAVIQVATRVRANHGLRAPDADFRRVSALQLRLIS